MEECRNILEFCEKFKELVQRYHVCNDITKEDEHFIDYWETYLAIAIVKDIGRKDCVRDIANIMLSMTA